MVKKVSKIPKAGVQNSLILQEIANISKGETLHVSPLRERIVYQNGSHPHFDTVQEILNILATAISMGIVREGNIKLISRNKENKQGEMEENVYIVQGLGNQGEDMDLLKSKIDVISKEVQNIQSTIRKIKS